MTQQTHYREDTTLIVTETFLSVMRSFVIIILLLLSIKCQSQTHREYFFDDQLTINDSTSLVLLILEPQTQFAREMNHRIYSDTNFIKELKESWYVEVQNEVRTIYKCGHDMYFYKLSGSELTYLNKLNSNCEITEVGCTNLRVLLESGRPLRVDTLTRIRVNTYRKDIFTIDLFKSYYINDSEQNWEISGSKSYPKIYYEGYFKTSIELDTNFTVNENAQNFLSTFTESLEGINWNIAKGEKINEFEKNKVSCEVEINVYLKSTKFELFKKYNIQKIDFNIKRGSSLILMYRN